MWPLQCPSGSIIQEPPLRRRKVIMSTNFWETTYTYITGALFVPPPTFKTLPAPLVTTAMIEGFEAVTGKCSQIVNIIGKPKPATTAHLH